MLARLATAICLAVLGAASAYAHPAPGIVCSPEGDIYFVVVPRSEVLVFPASHKHLAIALQPASARDLRVPHHLVLRDGHLYTASDAGSRVWRMRIGTGVLERIYPPPGAEEAAAPVGQGGDPFTIDDAGRIVAVQRNERGGYVLMRIERDGTAAPLAGGARGVQDGRGAEAGFGDLHGTTLTWGPDGAIYVADGGKFIRRVSPDGDVVTLFPPPRPANEAPDPNAVTAGELRGVAVGDDGTIYAADAANRCILRLRPDGRADRIGIAPADRPDVTLKEPTGVAVHPSGDVVVLDVHRVGDSESIRILMIRPDGSMMHRGTADVR